jgi:hypothetical protein
MLLWNDESFRPPILTFTADQQNAHELVTAERLSSSVSNNAPFLWQWRRMIDDNFSQTFFNLPW